MRCGAGLGCSSVKGISGTVNVLACLPNHMYIVFLSQQNDYHEKVLRMRMTQLHAVEPGNCLVSGGHFQRLVAKAELYVHHTGVPQPTHHVCLK